MRCHLLLCVLLGACSSSASDDDHPDRAAMEAAVVGSWTGTYDTATGRRLLVKVQALPAVQPKCGTHTVSIKCVTMTDMSISADVMTFADTIAMTGTASAMGSTADHAYLHLQSSAGDSLSCNRGGDHLVGCNLHLHGADFADFELLPVTD